MPVVSEISWIALGFVILVVVATIYLGIWATRKSKTASDFFVAGRSVNVFWNASAISGEYLSAASFMGVAGLIMKNGYDVLWYPVCYAAGYLFLLLFIAGPLRRFGAYTIPDFAEGRFDSPMFRKIAVIFVLFIGFFYTMPQMKGAGITMQEILKWPYYVGIVVVGAVITFNVALGGMKGITFVQAFQYWAKMFAISVPVFVLMAVYGWYGSQLNQNSDNPENAPRYKNETVFQLEASKAVPTTISFVKDSRYKLASSDEMVSATAGTKQVFTEPATLLFPPGAPPNAQSSKKWLEPFGTLSSKWGYPLLYTYSLILALVCGTAGLPHILVRFYTNPDGRSAKRTTFWVMVLIGVFYLFPPIWGSMGRNVLPSLYVTGGTDKVVIALPKALNSSLWGQILSGITSAGAFAAFMSTFSGLLVSMSGALAHDIYGRMLRPNASDASRLMAFKIAAIVFGGIAILLGLCVESFDINMMVGWAFAIAASSYFPLLLMGSWWRGLTKFGAGAGMLTGGLLSLIAIILHMLLDKKILVPPTELHKLVRTLMEQPAIWGVPLALIVMFVVSKLTQKSIPVDVDLKMLRLHAPEELGLSKNYIEH